MIEHQEFTGTSLESALQQAAEQFRRAAHELKYEVLSETRGFLGVGSLGVAVRVEVPPARPERPARRESRPPRAPAGSLPSMQPAGDNEVASSDEEAPPEVPMGPDPTVDKVLAMAQEVVRAAGLDLVASMSEHEDRIAIELAGPDRELLLDRRGETLNAVQYLINRMARKSLGTVKRIQLESGGFRSDRDEELRLLALDAAERVLQSGRPERLPPLNPYERRIVHLAISRRAGVTSESEGDSFIKRVVVRPAQGGRGRSLGGLRQRAPRGSSER